MSTMSFMDMFVSALMVFYARTNGREKPRRLYLGYKQLIALEEEYRLFAYQRTVLDGAPTRREYDGLPVFRVDADDHIEIT